jgi:hypothetical protein
MHAVSISGRKSTGSDNECCVDYAGSVVSRSQVGGADQGAASTNSIQHWPRVCRICDVPFVADHPRRYLCSDACLEESRRSHRAVRQAAYRMRHPNKDRCRQTIKNLVQSGVVRRPARCERCGTRTPLTEAHHFDYTKPFFVMWVCDPCHTLLELEKAGVSERTSTPTHGQLRSAVR